MRQWIAHADNERPVPADATVAYRLFGDDEVRVDRASSIMWGPGYGPEGLGRVKEYLLIDKPEGVGDVNGTTKGSAARFNSNKPPLDLIPAGIIATYESWRAAQPPVPPWMVGKARIDDWSNALRQIGNFQMRQGEADSLFRALFALDGDLKIWSECARVFDYGRAKYSAWNWARGQTWSIPIGSAMRHAMSGLRGEEIDPESGLSHRGHFACNIVMLLWFGMHYLEGDDRFQPPASAA